MIVKSDDAQRRNFLGIDFVLLSHGPESMVTKMLYKKEDNPPSHKHSNEQTGYVMFLLSMTLLPFTNNPAEAWEIEHFK